MIRYIILFLLIGFAKPSFAQFKPLPGPPRIVSQTERAESDCNRNCQYRYKYSVEERLKIYPFSKASKVQLVSFTKTPYSGMNSLIPLKNGRVDQAKLKESITLSNLQIDSLTSILYNVSYRGPFFTEVDVKCYNPRNAILFIDTTGKEFAFIELCFECMKHRLSSKRINPGDFCEQKYDLLENYFKDAGIRFGTIEKEHAN